MNISAGLESRSLNEVLAALPVGIIAVSPSGLVESWNPACEEIFGRTHDEAMGRLSPVVVSDSTNTKRPTPAKTVALPTCTRVRFRASTRTKPKMDQS